MVVLLTQTLLLISRVCLELIVVDVIQRIEKYIAVTSFLTNGFFSMFHVPNGYSLRV